MSSWVKVSRKLLTSAISSKPEYLAVWVHLLLSASYKPGEILVGHQVVRLQAGQLVFGRLKFSQQIGVSEHTLRMALKTLETLQQITIKSHSKFSVISITNWDKYQTDSPANHQQSTSNQPATHHNKEVQEIQELKPPISPKGEISEVVFSERGFEVPNDLINKWALAYPKASVEDEIAKAAVWAAANPAKRKKNWARFLNSWIAKAHTGSKAIDERDCPVDKIIALYHKECANLPPVAVSSDHVLRGLIVERWYESPEHMSSSFWKTIFHRANRMQQIYYRGANVMPRLELICSRSIFRQLEEQQ
jgi:hypothetical protein